MHGVIPRRRGTGKRRPETTVRKVSPRRIHGSAAEDVGPGSTRQRESGEIGFAA